MKKVLKKGFTLIELMVVIAIIGILATTLAPKLREQLAKAKDSKAVAFLGASRTVASSIIISGMTNDTSSETVNISWATLEPQMDVTTSGLMTDGELIIGGSRKKDGSNMTYGGTVALISTTTQGSNNLGTTGTGKVSLVTKTDTADIREASDLHLAGTTGVTGIKGATATATSHTGQDYSTEGKSWLAY